MLKPHRKMCEKVSTSDEYLDWKWSYLMAMTARSWWKMKAFSKTSAWVCVFEACVGENDGSWDCVKTRRSLVWVEHELCRSRVLRGHPSHPKMVQHRLERRKLWTWESSCKDWMMRSPKRWKTTPSYLSPSTCISWNLNLAWMSQKSQSWNCKGTILNNCKWLQNEDSKQKP